MIRGQLIRNIEVALERVVHHARARAHAAVVEIDDRAIERETLLDHAPTGIFDEKSLLRRVRRIRRGLSRTDLAIRIIADRCAGSRSRHVAPAADVVGLRERVVQWGRHQEGSRFAPTSRPSSAHVVADHETLRSASIRVVEEVEGFSGCSPFTYERDERFESSLRFPPTSQRHVKDAFRRYVVARATREAVDPARRRHEVAAHYLREVPAGSSFSILLRLLRRCRIASRSPSAPRLHEVIGASVARSGTRTPAKPNARRFRGGSGGSRVPAFAGLLWSKQFDRTASSRTWLEGGPTRPNPRRSGRAGGSFDWSEPVQSAI